MSTWADHCRGLAPRWGGVQGTRPAKQRLGAILAIISGVSFLLAAPPESAAQQAAEMAEARIDFERQIRPILASRCYKCHGPDEQQRQAELRLDQRTSAVPKAISPGQPERSKLVARISARDENERMPPSDSKLALTAREIGLLAEWVAQGAEYARHWSFVAPMRSPLPKVVGQGWARGEIDYFVLARLEAAGLSPAPEADRRTLLRRLSFDLTGLPPTLAELDSFLADASPDAYEKAVDRLLASPRYGERMAQDWLDLARYGDTNGFHFDSDRQIWLYRDWVIRAFNRNLSYDRFMRDQLAGDLLRGATLEERIATGFNRNNTYNEEGGADPEEFLVAYAVDRAATTGAVFLGLTLGCAQCHEHKYDPISQKEFYEFLAFFNNVAGEKGAQGHDLPLPPLLSTPSEAQARELASLDAEISLVEKRIRAALAKVKLPESKAPAELPAAGPREIVWIEDDLPPGAEPQGDEGDASWTWVVGPEHPVFSGKRATWRKTAELSQHFFTNADPELKIAAGDKLFTYVFIDPADPPKTLMLQFNDGLWEHRAYWGENAIPWGTDGTADRFRAGELPAAGKWERLEVDAESVGLAAGAALNGWAFTQVGGSVYWDKAGVVSSGGAVYFESQAAWETYERANAASKLAPELLELIKRDSARRTPAEADRLREYYLRHACAHTRALFAPFEKELAAIKERREALEKTIPTTMVMAEAANRGPTHVLIRGDFEQKGERVTPGVPRVLPPLPEHGPRNRLALAAWLADPANPLPARVQANRLWKQFFGAGLVRTPDDFGAQGEYPTHPELLDWLAVELRESGWNLKSLQKKIVMSAAYRQSSWQTAGGARRSGETIDPQNRLLWRQNRFRHAAEQVRDNALAAAGLLEGRIGGPSVFPYQPASYFGDKGRWTWPQSEGSDLHRRGLYTFWRRTTFYPSFQIFDAPSRETCTVDRPRTNTPLQALVTLNDPAFIEAARALGQRILSAGGQTPSERLAFAFRLVLSREATPDEARLLLDLHRRQHARYLENPKLAEALVKNGVYPLPVSYSPAELAAWASIANVLLNLDEAITRE